MGPISFEVAATSQDSAAVETPPDERNETGPDHKRVKLCFATNNLNKIKEVCKSLQESIELITLNGVGCYEELEEKGTTLEENSYLKAKYVWDNYHTNVIADDTGLEVEALNGAPGVYSARYAGTRRDEDNIRLLLENLNGVKNRTAHFRTIITLIMDGNVHQFEGSIRGQITTEPVGHNGFGYDAIFIPEGCDKTFAQMRMDEKTCMSHRYKAVKEMATFLHIMCPGPQPRKAADVKVSF